MCLYVSGYYLHRCAIAREFYSAMVDSVRREASRVEKLAIVSPVKPISLSVSREAGQSVLVMRRHSRGGCE